MVARAEGGGMLSTNRWGDSFGDDANVLELVAMAVQPINIQDPLNCTL